MMTDAEAWAACGQEALAFANEPLSQQSPILGPIYITANFPKFMRAVLARCQSWSLTLAVLRSAEITPLTSMNTLPFYLPMAVNGIETTYDKNGRIEKLKLGNDVIAGDTLRVFAGLVTRSASIAYVGDKAVMFLRNFSTRQTGTKCYLQTAARSLKITAPSAQRNYETYSTVLGHALTKAISSKVGLSTLTSVKQQLENYHDLQEERPLLSTCEINDQFFKCLLMSFDGCDFDFDEEPDPSPSGLVLKLHEGLSMIAVSQLSMSDLASHLQNIGKVRTLVAILINVRIFLPRAVNDITPLKGTLQNPISIQSLDNVGPASYVLTERQKSTPAAIRAFLANPRPRVYCTEYFPSVVVKGGSNAKKRNREEKSQAQGVTHPHDSVQASLFHAIREGVVCGPVEEHELKEGKENQPANPDINLIEF